MGSYQQEVKLFVMQDGKKTPWCCAGCGKQREGVRLTSGTNALLSCSCGFKEGAVSTPTAKVIEP